MLKLSLPTVALIVRSIHAITSFDDWIEVDQTDIYQNLSPCAQVCVRDVNQQIVMGDLPCQSYGCVCAESTQGLHFVYGLSNVTACAEKSCPANEVQEAEMAFQDLCLVYAASSTRPNTTEDAEILRITAEGYDEISECARFALNGCLDENGGRTEDNCGPIREWDTWEEYRGLAAERQCEKAECLCKIPQFDATFAVAYDIGTKYCGMSISTQDSIDEQYDQMQNLLAMYCTSEGYPPKDWFLRLVGVPMNSTETVTNVTNQTIVREDQENNDDGWTLSNKLQLGLGLGLGGIGVVLNLALLWLAFDQYRRLRKAEEEKEMKKKKRKH